MNSAKWGDLGVRTASAVVLIPAVIACAWFGGIWFKGFVLLLAVLIAHEWASLVHPKNLAQYALHMGAALCGAILPDLVGVGIALLVILGLAGVSIFMARNERSGSSMWSCLGIFYVGFPAIALILLRSDSHYGFAAVLWVFLVVWSADIMAYFAGRIIGGPKLAPVISPKKTWAGLAGAVAGSALVSLIPGHGGVIDRVDGLIAVAVAAALIGVFHEQGANAARGLLRW
jgi:phosphatidate cytidylyltransferase